MGVSDGVLLQVFLHPALHLSSEAVAFDWNQLPVIICFDVLARG